MKIEDQCVSLENAKKLSELGVEVESYFCHFHADKVVDRWWIKETHPELVLLPAYTVAELGSMLPNRIYGHYWFVIEKCMSNWVCSYDKEEVEESMHFEEGYSMVEAMAIMLIWLLENGHINAADLK